MAMSHSKPGPDLSCFTKPGADDGGFQVTSSRRFSNLATDHRGPIEIEGGDIQKATFCFRHLPAVNCGFIDIDESQKNFSEPEDSTHFRRLNHHRKLKLEESQRKKFSASSREGQPKILKRRTIQTQLKFGQLAKPSDIGVFAADEPAPKWMSPAEKASIVIGRMMVDAWSDDH